MKFQCSTEKGNASCSSKREVREGEGSKNRDLMYVHYIIKQVVFD